MGRQSSTDKSRVDSSTCCRTTQPGCIPKKQRPSPAIVTIDMSQAAPRRDDTGFALHDVHLAEVRYLLEKCLCRAQ